MCPKYSCVWVDQYSLWAKLFERVASSRERGLLLWGKAFYISIIIAYRVRGRRAERARGGVGGSFYMYLGTTVPVATGSSS